MHFYIYIVDCYCIIACNTMIMCNSVWQLTWLSAPFGIVSRGLFPCFQDVDGVLNNVSSREKDEEHLPPREILEHLKFLVDSHSVSIHFL